jgi:outer membrane protein assembly factor BamB
MQRWFGALTLVLGVATAGCGAMRAGAHPELPPFVERPNGAMSVMFQRDIRADSRIAGEPYERGQAELDPVRGRVFVGSSDRGLYALQADDGAVIWRFETLGFVQSAPLYDAEEDVVYFGSNDGALYKVAARTGQLLWRFMTNAEVSRRPIVSGDLVYVANANDTLLALDRKTGALKWNQHRTPAMGMEVAGYSGPTLYRGKLYAGFSDGTVIAFDAKTGAERWSPVDLAAEVEAATGETPQYLDVDTTPVVAELHAGPAVVVGSYVGGVFALDAETGSQIWANPGVAGVTELTYWEEAARPSKNGEPAEPPRRLLIASSGTTGLWGLNPETGAEIWRQSLPSGGVSAPVPISGALMVSTSRLGVFLISPLGGELIDGIHMADGSSVTPATHGTRAYVLTNGGALLGLRVAAPGYRSQVQRAPL